jgi:cation:H+ antiporter
VSLLTVSLFLDTFLSRIDGLVMLTGLVIVMIWLARLGYRSAANDPMSVDYDAEIPVDVSMKIAIFWIAFGLITLLIGAELLVDGSIEIARFLGVSEVVIGITLVALGTSLPELAVSVVSTCWPSSASRRRFRRLRSHRPCCRCTSSSWSHSRSCCSQ